METIQPDHVLILVLPSLFLFHRRICVLGIALSDTLHTNKLHFVCSNVPPPNTEILPLDPVLTAVL